MRGVGREGESAPAGSVCATSGSWNWGRVGCVMQGEKNREAAIYASVQL